MPQIRAHEVDVFYRDEGNGPAIVLGHSSLDSSGQWRPLISRLSNRFRLLAPDHLGYGQTGSGRGSPSLIEHELSIIDALIELVGQPVHLVGHSYGGVLMARSALRHRAKVRSLTLIEPTLFYILAPGGKQREHDEISAVADSVARYVDAGAPEQATRTFLDYWVGPDAFDMINGRAQAAVVAGMQKLRAEIPTMFQADGSSAQALQELSLPIQLVKGSQTTAAASAVIELLRAVWPQARYAEVAGAGHMLPLTHARQVNTVIEEFLDAREMPRPETAPPPSADALVCTSGDRPALLNARHSHRRAPVMLPDVLTLARWGAITGLLRAGWRALSRWRRW
jgi:pimeloyl-ACP methyl ester carboxylesterase